MNLETTPPVTGIVDEILAELPPLFFISEQQIPLLGKSPYFAHRKEKEGLFQAGVCLVSNAQSLLEAKQKELASIEAMVRMLEENEWAEHVGMLGGPIARRLETEITRMHNEQQALIAQQAALAAVPDGEKIREAIREALGDAYDCTRVWSAWSYGTMSQDDFESVAGNDERVDEIACAVEQVLSAAPAQPEQATQADMNAAVDRMRRENKLSIDGDNAYKRDLLDVIVGALAFGYLGTNQPPEGHWANNFWDTGRAEGERAEQYQEQILKLRMQLAQQAAQVDVQDMVDRFLGWKLPDNFSPDAGISFSKPSNPAWWPTGTNLLSADQAKAMFQHVLAAAPTRPAQQQNQPQNIPEIIPAVAPVSVQDELRAKAENFVARMRKGAEGDRAAERELEGEDADEAQACAVQAYIQENAASMVEQLLAAAPTPPERGVVAWSKPRFIRDPSGFPIGQDDPELVWGQEPPESSGWLPLYPGPLPAAPTPPAQQSLADGRREGIEAAAEMIEKQAAAYAMEFGYDDLGALSFGAGPHAEAKRDHYTTLCELVDDVRALLNATDGTAAPEQASAVPWPQTEDEAIAMEQVGYAWLKQNAQHRLKDLRVERVTDEMVQAFKVAFHNPHIDIDSMSYEERVKIGIAAVLERPAQAAPEQAEQPGKISVNRKDVELLAEFFEHENPHHLAVKALRVGEKFRALLGGGACSAQK